MEMLRAWRKVRKSSLIFLQQIVLNAMRLFRKPCLTVVE